MSIGSTDARTFLLAAWAVYVSYRYQAQNDIDSRRIAGTFLIINNQTTATARLSLSFPCLNSFLIALAASLHTASGVSALLTRSQTPYMAENDGSGFAHNISVVSA